MHIAPAFKISTLAKKPHLTSEAKSVLTLSSLQLNVNHSNVRSAKMLKITDTFLAAYDAHLALELMPLKQYYTVFEETVWLW